jgi:N-acetyl-alpha-D-muramate 1-phosphate uridylyltransferase
MKAMILAAGRGLRMGKLTAHTAKPLLKVKGKALIQWHIEKCVNAGITELIINHAWHGEQIEAALGDGSAFGARIVYSREDTALETAGGIAQARDLIAEDTFAVISADIFSSYDYSRLPSLRRLVAALHEEQGIQGYCVMVPNPNFNAQGDFGFINGLLTEKTHSDNRGNVTFGNIAIYHADLFSTIGKNQHAKLGDTLRHAVPQGRILGELFLDSWFNVGTAEQLRDVGG